MTPAPAPISIQDTIQSMVKYIGSGDPKDLGELGTYLGLTQDDSNDTTTTTSTSTSTTTATVVGIQKPKDPIFKLPISYLPPDEKHSISSALSDDLELLVSKDSTSTRSLYESLFFPNENTNTTVYAKQYVYMWGETFTTNLVYLKNTQEFITRFHEARITNNNNPESKKVSFADDYKTVDEFWTAMKTNRTGFKDKFGYFDVPPLPIIEKIEQLNGVPTALQLLSVYNVSTPVISLMMPILVLILPFFIIKSRGIDINVDKYIEVLKTLASNHAVGKLFTEFSSVSIERKMYILMSVMFYIMQIYQNTMSCWRFYKNIYTIHDHLVMVREYLKQTAKKMESVLQCCNSLQYYSAFSGCLGAELETVRYMCSELEVVQPFSLCLRAVSGVGYVMKQYYLFFNDASTDAMMRYTFGFNAYYDHICGISHHIASGVLNKCTFVSHESSSSSSSAAHTSMQDAYFLNTAVVNGLGTGIVKNDIVLDKKLLITGPNAAGKTTTIKTTIFNVLLSQQFGYGVYKSANIVPYHFLHCYLNIPDTSGRDSLFQAESRRCKEILDCITANSTKRHFGIFDELYSGTNPYEAVASAYGYIHHISGMKNVDFMLTTHYISLCELFEPPASKQDKKKRKDKKDNNSKSKSKSKSKDTNCDGGNPNIRNLHMKTTIGESGTDHVYHYKVVHGISKVRGGLKVLVDLNYPDEIIQTTKYILDKKK
jgi:hypothetical protein